MSSFEENTREYPLTAMLAGVSDQTRAQIEYYIERGNGKLFSLARSFDKPDVVIMDYDHPGTTERIASGEWRSDVILIILVAGDHVVDGAIMIGKPLASADLENAAAIALQKLNGHATRIAEIADTQDQIDVFTEAELTPMASEGTDQSLPKLTQRADTSRPDDSETPAYFRTSDAALPGPPTLSMMMRVQRYRDKINLLCGPHRTLEQLRDPTDPEHRYDPSSCLSSRVARFVFNQDPSIKAVYIKLPDAEIYILPTLNKVYTSISLEYKRNVNRLFNDWDDEDIEILEFDKDTVNHVIDTLNQSTRYSFSAQSFCWLSSLFSAQGRLPLGFDISSSCKMLHWPNITRLELIPDSLEIAAAWTNNLASLEEIIERVQCEPRHAVSFFNAACRIKVLTGAIHHEH